MAWIQVVHGVGVKAKVANKDVYEIRDVIDADMDLLQKAIDDNGGKLKVFVTPNSDDNSVSVFGGHELHDERHIYQGQTLVFPVNPVREDALEWLAGELTKIMRQHVGDVPLERADGIVLCQFD